MYNLVRILGGRSPKLVRSSWEEYMGEVPEGEGICDKDIILGQFRNRDDYKKFSESTVKEIVRRRKEDEEISKLLIE